MKFSAVIITTFCLLVAGCSSDPKIVPVSGTVTIDGKPLEHGSIQMAPEGFRAASGKIGPGGRFTLTTFKEGDGVAVGTHKVAIVATESIDGSKQRWHAPEKYVDFETSGLTATISGPMDDLKIELTWSGDSHSKPYLQHFSSSKE